MKENFSAVILGNTDSNGGKSSALSPVIYTPAIWWVKNTLANVGLADNEFLVYGKEISDKTKTELMEYLNKAEDYILLLSVDIPLVSEKDINTAYKHVEQSGALLVDENPLTGIGWYKKEVLVETVKNMDNINIDKIKENINLKEFKIIKTNSVMLALGSPINNNIINKQAKEITVNSHLGNGVEIPIDDGVIISPQAQIEKGATILSGTIIKGESVIKGGSTIGPNSVIENSIIGSGVQVNASHIENSVVNNNAKIGPMARIRPNSTIGEGVKLGNFVEIKNSSIGEKTAVSHLTYVGDSDVGMGCNIGCGVVTVNYDGTNKNRTTIGDYVFVGCNCNLIAPVTLADESYIAAGTTITQSVPRKALAIGRSKQEIKENWTDGKNLRKKT